ncbi:glycoside hydrolase family 43 protein [Streptomyces mangrovisoli]|uniref:Glycoside hydrolase 43 family protein n=1 Tax=Streptomyces mangrovisoli TaxID=1428628 RepID=A0A1J4NY40_9ACTN|nr:glycoside hydrolase family 43 protein [Streptomyces mangrovisoli]OIJ66962.1 glycoside hydrolase 43 family protein [Streptomyces mangrovisoli]
MPTYDNPVLPGFHPDPSVCRVGADYYAACSSFEYFPGVPLFHSRDLVHWRQIGNVLDRPGQLVFADTTPASGGIYAPTLRHHDGRFWLITTDASGGGTFLVTAEDPRGPWSDPVWIDVPGIDPDLAWDDDGSCWCAVSGCQVARIDPETGKVLEGPLPLWSGTGLRDPEAPHLYRVGEWWYLLIAEGGTALGHGVSAARARSPRGPWEPAPGNPLLSHRGTASAVQCTGHADLVEAADGTWWMLLLGTRPRGYFPEYHALGRETFLVPVEWADGWPRVGPVRERHPAPAAWHPLEPAPARDDFDAPALAPYWISPRSRPDDCWSLTERPGWLTLRATGDSLDRPGATFLGRRQQHHDCRVATRVDPGAGRAGLSVRIDESHHYDIEVHRGVVSAVARIGPLRQRLAEHFVPAGPVTLVVETRTPAGQPRSAASGGPDEVLLSVEHAGGTFRLAALDGRYLSSQVAGGFTGRVIGMYVTEGAAAFDWCEHGPAPAEVPQRAFAVSPADYPE